MSARTTWIVAALAATLVAAAAAAAVNLIEWRRAARADEGLRRRVDQRVAALAGTEVDCAALRQRRPLVLLALGQSNAGNHGSAKPRPGDGVFVVTGEGRCYRSADPLPGATGTGASIWSRLPSALAALGVERPVVFALLAVDASSILEWTSARSPLPPLLDTLSRALLTRGLAPALVLWQQGEADARAGTPADVYQQGLRNVAARLRTAGVTAPLVLARSTICRNEPSAPLREAIAQLSAADPQFVLGPDTDALAGEPWRSDGCHFAESGLQAAAERWAQVLAPLLR